MKEMESELKSSRDSIIELEESVEDREVKLANKAKYITILEKHLVESTAIMLYLEGQLCALRIQLGLAEDWAVMAKVKATTAEAMVKAVREKVAQVVMRYKAQWSSRTR